MIWCKLQCKRKWCNLQLSIATFTAYDACFTVDGWSSGFRPNSKKPPRREASQATHFLELSGFFSVVIRSTTDAQRLPRRSLFYAVREELFARHLVF